MSGAALDRLRSGARESDVPFRLQMRNGRSLVCHEVLRLLPGRRLVARTEWQGGPAVLKLFLGTSAARYCARERDGLARAGALAREVPRVLEEIALDDMALGLVLEYVPDSTPLAPGDGDGFGRAAGLLARLHTGGVWQTDMNLSNLLMAHGVPWLVDGDGVRAARAPLGRGGSLDNLALLLAERPPRLDGDSDLVLARYCRARGWRIDAGSRRRLARRLTTARRHRNRRYLDKSLRDCREFAVSLGPDGFTARRRDWNDAAWDVFLADPDGIMAAADLLKAGNSATVARWRPPAGPSLVVKRYNLKSTAHSVRRALKPRARRAWRAANLLTLLEIPTARPLALLERRHGPLAGVSYLLMEDLGDEGLLSAMAGDAPPEAIVEQVVGVFTALKNAGLAHGDTKATNFLLADGVVHVVDVDAVRQTTDGWRRDVARFLENFDGVLRSAWVSAFRAARLL
ncbi:MAG: lipopolysaccharide kinase InaA family protein [Myxococcales bacterium]|jgi:hypothetical protein